MPVTDRHYTVLPNPETLAERSEFARSMTLRRVHAGLSQKRLAAIVGVTDVYIGQVERGESKPSAALLARIKQALSWTD